MCVLKMQQDKVSSSKTKFSLHEIEIHLLNKLNIIIVSRRSIFFLTLCYPCYYCTVKAQQSPHTPHDQGVFALYTSTAEFKRPPSFH